MKTKMNRRLAEDILFASYYRLHGFKDKAHLGIPKITPDMLRDATAIIAAESAASVYRYKTPWLALDIPKYNWQIITLFWEALRLNPSYLEDYRTRSDDIQYFQGKYYILTPLNPDVPLSHVTFGQLNRAALDTVGVTVIIRHLPLIPRSYLVEEVKRIYELHLPADPAFEVRPVINFPESFRALKVYKLAQEGRSLDDIIKVIDYPCIRGNEDNYDDEYRKEKAKYDLEKGAGLVNFAGDGLREFLRGDVQPRPRKEVLRKLLKELKLRARPLRAKGLL